MTKGEGSIVAVAKLHPPTNWLKSQFNSMAYSFLSRKGSSEKQWHSLLHSPLNPEVRRKQKWDQERLKWRELQQQLGDLRSVRAEREKSKPKVHNEI